MLEEQVHKFEELSKMFDNIDNLNENLTKEL